LLFENVSMSSLTARARISTSSEVLSPFKARLWMKLTAAERLRRSWALRKRLPDLRAVHDRKLFPKP
jgi:hypothetical protein